MLIHVTIVRAYIRALTDIQQSAELTEELGGNYRFSQFPEQIYHKKFKTGNGKYVKINVDI